MQTMFRMIDQASLNGGDEAEDRQGMVNDVELTTPYVVGSDGVYIGYALTITDASDGTTKFLSLHSTVKKRIVYLYVPRQLQKNGAI